MTREPLATAISEIADALARTYTPQTLPYSAIVAMARVRQAAEEIEDLEQQAATLAKERDEARAALTYKGRDDTDDDHSEAILAAHPMKSGDWSHWSKALEMVSNRKSKGSLVMLVNWLLLKERTAFETGADEMTMRDAAIAVLTTQRDKAVDALRPFADDGRGLGTCVQDETGLFYEGSPECWRADFNVGDLRQAATVVREIENG